MGRIIQREKSVIPACDVFSLRVHENLVRETADIDAIGAYKVGFILGLGYGLPKVVGRTRLYTEKPIIYDGQKAGTDIPDTGKAFAKVMKNAGVNAIILFPQSGPETQRAWTESALEQGLGVIVGGLMTHPKYVRSQGGYIADEAIMEMYFNAVEMGVTDFVVPGNKPDKIREIREALELNRISPTFYAPGFVAQGGSISDAARAAGNSWHGIVGRGLYEAENIRNAALGLTSQL